MWPGWRWVFWSKRWTELSVEVVDLYEESDRDEEGVREGEGKRVTRYESIEVFGGVLAYVIKWLYGEGINEGFKEAAEGLKKRCERPAEEA
jgi:hypothetical protein